MKDKTVDTVKIIKANISHLNDVAPLFVLYREFYNGFPEHEASKEFIKQRLTNNESTIFIAYFDNNGEKTACGFVQLYPSFSSVSAKRSIILNDLYVDEAYRQKGIARRLMETAKEYAQSQQANGLSLSTAHDNVNAQALYESLGYEQDKQYLHYFLSIK